MKPKLIDCIRMSVPRRMGRRIFRGGAELAVGFFLALAPMALAANGGTYGMTSDGLLFRKEPRVVMAKERLFISLDKIRVEYAFRNDSDQEVSTDILFPAGDHDLDPDSDSSYCSASGFRVWSDGISQAVVADFRSVLPEGSEKANKDPFYDWGGRDVTSFLRPLGLSRPDLEEAQLRRLEPEALIRLWKQGITPVTPAEYDSLPDEGAAEAIWFLRAQDALKNGVYRPNWIIHELYHWHQVFPPRKQVNLVIEYKPVPRSEDWYAPADVDSLYQSRDEGPLPSLDGGKRSLRQQVLAQARALGLPSTKNVFRPWIEYVLTTANTWKGSIEDFELIVDGGARTPVSFLWPRPVERLGPNRYRVRIKHFQPKRNLLVHFFKFVDFE